MTGRKARILDQIPAREWGGLVPHFGEHARFHLTATCACGVTETFTTRTLFEPAAAVARVRRLGWKTGKPPVCPACQATRKPKKEKPVMAANNNVVVDIAPPAKPVPKASDAARTAKRLAHAAIEVAYDDVALRYKPGQSDASIAKETGLAEDAIAKIREEFFGPAGEPDEITALRLKLDERYRQIDQLAATFNADVAAARTAIADMRGEMVALCRRNGWKA